jgi:hypothetical protein
MFSEKPDLAYSGMGPSMFESLVQRRPGPELSDMIAAQAAATQNQRVELKEVVVRTYDLGDPSQHDQYVKDTATLLMGTALRTHVILAKEPLRFTESSGGPRYIAHMQWAEFTIIQEPIKTTPVGGSAA